MIPLESAQNILHLFMGTAYEGVECAYAVDVYGFPVTVVVPCVIMVVVD